MLDREESPEKVSRWYREGSIGPTTLAKIFLHCLVEPSPAVSEENLR